MGKILKEDLNTIFEEDVSRILNLVKSNYNIVGNDLYVLKSRYMRDKENDISLIIKKYMGDHGVNYNIHMESEDTRIKRVFGFNTFTPVEFGTHEVEYNNTIYNVVIQYIPGDDSYDLCVLVVNVQQDTCEFFLETITNTFLKFIGNKEPKAYISNWGMEIALKRLIEFNNVESLPTKITKSKLNDVVKKIILRTNPSEDMEKLIDSVHKIEQE